VARAVGAQEQGRRIGRTGRRHDNVPPPALLAPGRVTDNLGSGPAAGIGLDPLDHPPRQQGDIGQVQQGLNGDGAGVALGLQQAGKPAAGLALDAGRSDRVGLIQLDADRQVERLPALGLPVVAQLGYAGVVVDGGIGVGRFITVLCRVHPPGAVHLPEISASV